MNLLVSEQFRTTAQDRIRDRLLGDLAESDAQLQEIGLKIAKLCDAKIKVGPVKAEERARQKVSNDYGGDWFEMKDMVRLTLIVPDQGRLRALRAAVQTTCAPRDGLSLMKDYEATPENTPCGYSGLNFVVRLRNGRPGEIQANVPQVMYGNLMPKAFCDVIGPQEHDRLKAAYQVEGGFGHGLYEIYRVGMTTPNGIAAKNLCRAYFKYLRGVPNLFVGRDLQLKLNLIKQKHLHIFH